MRITPNHPRLRLIAIVCLALGSWVLLQPGILAHIGLPPILVVLATVLGTLLLALGFAFWLLGTDRRAGIILDRKGLMLNLGHSAAFVAWENIAATGVCRVRASLLAVGSSTQLGIRLHNIDQYLQSHEARIPASTGLIARALGGIKWLLTPRGREPGQFTRENLVALERRTGYHLLIPEAQLGRRAGDFLALLEAYRHPS